MKLEHIAISVNNSSEIENFYRDILGMNVVKSFTLNKSLAENIFGIEKDISVFLVKKDELILEIFVVAMQDGLGFNHICLAVKNREELVAKAEQNNYKCIRIEREISDLIFVKDKSGNIFEIKEK